MCHTKTFCTLYVKSMMMWYGLNDWKFKWCKLSSIGGDCNKSTKTIRISNHVLNAGFLKVRETTLHEIAHALTFDDDDTDHGPIWKEKFISMGGSGDASVSLILKKSDYNYVVRCGSIHCNYKDYYFNRTVVHCPKCGFHVLHSCPQG